MAINLKKISQQGLTLTELMVAMAIVGIVMLGIVSADYAIQKFYKDSSTGAVSGFNAMAMMTNISKAAFEANGSFTNPNSPGILINSDIAKLDNTWNSSSIGTRTLCFQILDGGTNWKCYSLLTESGVQSLYSCGKSSAGSCTVADTKLAAITNLKASFEMSTTVNGQFCYFEIQIEVPDTDNSTRTYQARITPPKHRL